MRLIDADELIKEGWRLERHGQANELIGIKSLADVPTAYDVDKVLERILGLRSNYISLLAFIQDAIEIVKAGGKNA